jgi:chromosome segregation ATPase
MSAFAPFWQRVGSALKGSAAHLGVAPRSSSSLIVTTLDPPASQSRSAWPWQRRSAEQTERFTRLIRMIDSIREQFAERERQGRQLNESVAMLSSTLERVASAQIAQAESLAVISRAVEASSRFGSTLTATLQELPAAMQAQAEAVWSVASRLEAANAIDAQLSGTLDRVASSVDSLQDAGRSCTGAIERLSTRDESQQTALHGLVREQNRRLALLTWIVAAVAIAGAGGLTAFLIRTLA